MRYEEPQNGWSYFKFEYPEPPEAEYGNLLERLGRAETTIKYLLTRTQLLEDTIEVLLEEEADPNGDPKESEDEGDMDTSY